jgi:hypothetical protein
MYEPNCKVVFGYSGYRLIVHQYPRKWYSLHKGDRLITAGGVLRIALNIAIRRLPQPAPILANLPSFLARFFNFLEKFEVNLRKGVRKWRTKWILLGVW